MAFPGRSFPGRSFPGRYAIRDAVLGLDPQTDAPRIAYLSAAFDFPWDTERAYELALLRTFAVPTSSGLMVATGEFVTRTQKRYDDTSILISAIGLHGYDSPEGRAAIRRMNQIHRRYPIPNDEYLYVLSTFVLEPLRWNARYGWRLLTAQEKEASFWFWREVARRMNIRDIPESLEALEAWSLDYERLHFAYSPHNQALAEAVRDLFCSWVLPKGLWGLGRELVYAVLEPPLLAAFGFPAPRPWALALVRGGLRARAALLPLLPPRRRPHRPRRSRSYPAGYALSELGPQDARAVPTRLHDQQ